MTLILEFDAPTGANRYAEDAKALVEAVENGHAKAAMAITIDISGAKAGSRKPRGGDTEVEYTADEDAERIVANEKAAFQAATRELGFTARAKLTESDGEQVTVTFQLADKQIQRTTGGTDADTPEEKATPAPAKPAKVEPEATA